MGSVGSFGKVFRGEAVMSSGSVKEVALKAINVLGLIVPRCFFCYCVVPLCGRCAIEGRISDCGLIEKMVQKTVRLRETGSMATRVEAICCRVCGYCDDRGVVQVAPIPG